MAWTYTARGAVRATVGTKTTKTGKVTVTYSLPIDGTHRRMAFGGLPVQLSDVRRVVKTALAAWKNPDYRQRGLFWYDIWDEVAVCLAERFGVSHDVARGMLCATSAGMPPDRNIECAVYALQGVAPSTRGCYPAADKQCEMIRDGVDWRIALNLKDQGRKVYSFCWNTFRRGLDFDHVTIDRWARRTLTGDYKESAVESPWYGYFVRVYQMAAQVVSRRLGVTLTPAQVQALCWVHDKETHGEPDATDVWAELSRWGVSTPPVFTLTVR